MSSLPVPTVLFGCSLVHQRAILRLGTACAEFLIIFRAGRPKKERKVKIVFEFKNSIISKSFPNTLFSSGLAKKIIGLIYAIFLLSVMLMD